MVKNTASVVVLVDHIQNDQHNFVLTSQSKKLLTAVRKVIKGDINVVALNSNPDIAALQSQGVKEVIVPNLAGLCPRVGAVVADAILAGSERVQAEAIFCISNYLGKEVSSRLATKLGSGVSVDVTEVNLIDDKLVASRSVLEGAWNTVFQVTAGIPVIALRLAGVEIETAPESAAPIVTEISVDYSPEAKAVTVVSSKPEEASGNIPLTEAEVVVCGGRGVEGDFTVVNELAKLLDGAVGSTRVAADEGWISRSTQIGQSGITIVPELYIGLGVSGAVHHTCGMQTAETIVAVTDDPDAPIFELADFGVVGKISEVVPQAISALEKMRALSK